MNNEMIEKIRNLKDKKKLLFIAVFICLIMLILLSYGSSETEKSPESTTSSVIVDEQAQTQKKLEEIIARIDGVGNVSVMITYGSSGEYVYAENSKSESNGDKQSVNSEIVLHESPEGNDEGLIVSVKNPDISGVAVVCDGGYSMKIKAEITELVTRLFGIGADRVYVGTNAS